MATRAGTYLPIRPAGYKPAPVPYFKELMTAQNMLPVGILAAAASAGDDDKKKKPAGVAVSTPAVPPPDEDPTEKFKDIKTLTERVISSEVDKLPGGQEVKQLELFDDLQEIAKIRPEKSKIDEKVIGEYFPDENYGLEENIDWAEALDRSQTDINNFVDGLIKGEVDLRVNQYIKADKLMQEVKEEMFVGDEPLEPIGDILGIIDVERPDPILRFLEEGLIDKLQSLETNKYTQVEVVAHELGHIAGNQWEMINTNEVLRLSRDIQEDVKNNYPTIMTKHTFERAKKLIKKMKKKDYFDDSELVREVFADEASQMPAIREAAKKLLNAFTPRELFPREIKTRTRKNMGGLVGISHLTRPLRNFSS